MHKDAQAYVKTCNKCQRFNNIIRQPTEELTSMMAPWPFVQWELDIMCYFLIVIRQLKFLVVGIDYFTKWVEVEALATITEKNIRNFVWRNIICRYEIPRVLVTEISLTISRSRIFAHNWGSRITTPHLPTLRPTEKLRL